MLESTLSELHGVMRSKRAHVHALEEDLEIDNPEVFGEVQVGCAAEWLMHVHDTQCFLWLAYPNCIGDRF